jgi:biopolymer transport protein ExbB
MQFDLAHIWASMGLVSKLIAFGLVIMAVASIAVIVERLITLSRAAGETRRFAQTAKPVMEAWDVPRLIEISDEYKLSPLARVVNAAARRYQRATEEPEGGVTPVELARREVARKREAISSDLRRGLSVLASVGSVAPFVGLLGTVVGIISAFQSIASTGSGGLGAVSAGISEALIETALGLVVAIPAVLFFNYLTGRINLVEQALERSSGELLDEMENVHGRISSEQLTAGRSDTPAATAAA